MVESSGSPGRAAFALAFINSYGPGRPVVDVLVSPRDCAAFLKEHDFTWQSVNWARAAARMAHVRDRLRAIAIALAAGELSIAEVRGTLNNLLDRAPWVARLEMEAHEAGVRLSFVPRPDQGVAERAIATAVAGFAELVEGHGAARLRQCVSLPCEDVFVDHSKAGRQRFCSKKCANRHNVAAFRKRAEEVG